MLADGGARIGATLDVVDTARALADVSVPRLADGVAIDVLEPVLAGGDLDPGPVPGEAALRRVAARARDDAPPEMCAVSQGDPLPPAIADEVLAVLQPRLVDPRARGTESTGQVLRTVSTPGEDSPWLLVVPLVAQDRALGLASFCRWGSRRPFESDDLSVAEELASRTAVCLDNARRFLREHEILRALRTTPRPLELPPHHALEVASEHVDAGSGGDWVDAVPLPGARTALIACHVPGRGVHTAATAGRFRSTLHTFSDLDLEPDDLLARLDDLVRRFGAETVRGEKDAGKPGATCVYAIYDPVSRHCSLASAGHPPPLLVRPDGRAGSLDMPVGAPLGRPGAPFERADVELPEQSLLVLYTPGPDRGRSNAPAPQRLAALLARSSGEIHLACRNLRDELASARPRFDAAVLVTRTHALAETSVASWDLPSDPAIVSTARLLVARQLEEWAMDDEVFATELIVSELVTNAIRHAEPPVRLRLIRSDVLTCEVSDGSSTTPRLRHARVNDEGGRGLLLAARCSQRWGARYTDQGKIVWVEQLVHTRSPLS